MAANRGNRRRVVLVSADGTVEVFPSVSAFHAARHKRVNWLNARKGYKSDAVRLPDGSTCHILRRGYRAEDWTEVAEDILKDASSLASSLASATRGRFDDILDDALELLMRRLARADLRRFESRLHCVHTCAAYVRQDWFRRHRRPDPLQMRVADYEQEQKALEESPSAAQDLDELVALLLPERLQALARMKAAGFGKRKICRALRLRPDDYEAGLRDIAEALGGGPRPLEGDSQE